MNRQNYRVVKMSSQSETGSSLWCGYLESHLHSNEVTALGSSILPEERKRSEREPALREHGEADVFQNVLVVVSAIAHSFMHMRTYPFEAQEQNIPRFQPSFATLATC